jgi:glutathione S-transferase
MTIKLYIDYMSQPCRAILIFCGLAKIPIEITEVNLSSGAHLKPPCSTLNPSRRIPFIIDTTEQDFLVFESEAIVRYLSAKFLTAKNPLYPRDSQEK